MKRDQTFGEAPIVHLDAIAVFRQFGCAEKERPYDGGSPPIESAASGRFS